MEYEKCEQKGCHVEENRGQGVISDRQKWYGCQKKKEIGVTYPRRGKAQQSGTWAGVPEGTAKEESKQREVRRTFKMLRKVWLNIGIEKLDTHEGVTVKVLLDSGTTGMFMDKRAAAKHGFMLQKLEKPIKVRNVDGTNNSRGAITHQVEVNVYYKSHVERMRMDVCDLGKTEVILGVTNFIWTITPGILDRFRRSKWPPKALKKTFLTVPKTSQSDQYSPSYQQISL